MNVSRFEITVDVQEPVGGASPMFLRFHQDNRILLHVAIDAGDTITDACEFVRKTLRDALVKTVAETVRRR